MKSLRKNEIMYSLFGKRPGHTCRECCNLVKIQAGQRVVRKCKCYGLSASQATDFSEKFEACGLFGKSTAGRQAVEIEGQADFWCRKEVE